MNNLKIKIIREERRKMSQAQELENIIGKFAESGWDLIDGPSKKWLESKDENHKTKLIKAIKQADNECGSCGCEFDPLYKKALKLLA